MARDYYDILGLSKSASDSEIKSSYRKLAMKYHHDRNPGDKKAEDKFKEISESYEILKDPQKNLKHFQLLKIINLLLQYVFLKVKGKWHQTINH